MIILSFKALQPLLIKLQTVANEAYDQIRTTSMERLQDRLGKQAMRPQGEIAKYLDYTLVVELSVRATCEWLEKCKS